MLGFRSVNIKPIKSLHVSYVGKYTIRGSYGI